MPTLVAGVDCSTQATKVVVVDAEGGRIVAEGRAEHAVSGRHGARETDPRTWWSALGQALDQTRLADRVQAISVAGQQHGLVVLGGDRAPLRPAILWNDVRAAEDARALRDDLGAEAWAQRIGLVPVAALTISSWAWLRRVEPDIAAAAAAVRLPHDYLTERLCGEAVTDRGDASGTGWWSATSGRYDREVLALDRVRLAPELLPRVLGPAEAAGHLRAEAGAELGLSAGIPVGPGTGDNMAAALALATPPGMPVMSIGTSGTVYCVSASATADPSGIVTGFADASGRFLPLACTLNATLAIDRVAQWLGLDREAVRDGGEVAMLPFLDGERTPDLPHAAGTLVGLRHDTTPGQILRAAYEGAVFTLLEALDHLTALTADAAAPEHPLVLIGGGARGTTWRETIASASGRALVIPRAGELVALGAAAQAAAVLAGQDPVDVAGCWALRDGLEIEARPRDEPLMERYRAVLHAAAPLNEGIPT